MKMKKALFMAAAVIACAGAASASTPETTSTDSGFKIDGEVRLRYRVDRNTNNQFGNGTYNGTRGVLLLNMSQKLDKHLSLYARYSYVNAPDELTNNYAADVVEGGHNHYSTIDQYGLTYKNGNWNYKVGAQNLTLGATGLLYDDTRYFGRHIMTQAINANGKIGKVAVNGILAKSNYDSDYENDKIFYVHGSLPVNRSTYGLGYARVNYGDDTAAAKVEDGKTGMNYYTADFSYKLTDNTFFHSEFIKSSASDNNNGVNLVLFHIFDAKNNGGIAWFRVEGQAGIQQRTEGNMTYQWGNAQGYGVFFNHKINKDLTFSFTDFEMKQIDTLTFPHNPSGMPGDQNTMRIDLTYKF